MAFVLIIMPAFGQSETKNNKIIADSKTAKADYLVAKALMKGFLIQLMNMLFYKSNRFCWHKKMDSIQIESIF